MKCHFVTSSPRVVFRHFISFYQPLAVSEREDSVRAGIKETTVPLAWHLASIVQIPADDLVPSPQKNQIRLCFLFF